MMRPRRPAGRHRELSEQAERASAWFTMPSRTGMAGSGFHPASSDTTHPRPPDKWPGVWLISSIRQVPTGQVCAADERADDRRMKTTRAR